MREQVKQFPIENWVFTAEAFQLGDEVPRLYLQLAANADQPGYSTGMFVL